MTEPPSRSVFRTRSRPAWPAAAALFALLVTLPSRSAATPDPADWIRSAPSSEVLRRFVADRRSVDDFYSLRSSPARAERLAAFHLAWRGHVGAKDFAGLDADARVDWLLLRTEIDAALPALRRRTERLEGVRELVPFAREILALEEARRALEDVDPQAAAARLAELTEEVKDLRDRVRRPGGRTRNDEGNGDEDGDEDGKDDAPPLETAPVLAVRAAGVTDEAGKALEHWYDSYADYRPDFGWWMDEPYRELAEALEKYAEHLRKKVAGLKGEDDDPLIGDPLGRDGLVEAIAGELIAYSPEELLAVARAELAWCEERMADAARRLGHDDWRDALERVKGLHVAPGEQNELVAEQARAALEWLDARDLVTVEPLCRETWRVEMLSKKAQRTLPFAAYSGQAMLVAFPTRDMDHETKEMSLRGNNRHFTRIVTPHELIPGHHLQGYMEERYAAHRSPFSTPFLVEGWALYWEMVLWDEGFAESPEDEIGMLFWRMHRCARILVTIRFHLGRMTPQEMVDFLVERIGHEQHTATAEVRRYVGEGYSPLYQCAYMLGGLQLRALARELVDAGRLTRKEFHDAVLRQGPIPVALIRARLTGEELTPDWESHWRFAGEPR